MSELQTTPRLSLFQIEGELLGLIEAREDALERHFEAKEMPAILAIEEELKAIEGLIRDYLKAEIRKVDNIAYTVKEFEARAAARSSEAAKMKAQADRDAETAKRIKQMVLEVMQEFGEKKLPGRLFTISRQGNGGVQALTIAQPELVPLSHKKVIVTMSALDWVDIAPEDTDGIKVECVPDGDEIRHTLEIAQKRESALHLEAAGKGWTDEQLSGALSKVERVPGCRLEERGEHVRIK